MQQTSSMLVQCNTLLSLVFRNPAGYASTVCVAAVSSAVESLGREEKMAKPRSILKSAATYKHSARAWCVDFLPHPNSAKKQTHQAVASARTFSSGALLLGRAVGAVLHIHQDTARASSVERNIFFRTVGRGDPRLASPAVHVYIHMSTSCVGCRHILCRGSILQQENLLGSTSTHRHTS